jgi:hypothetical protein
MLSRVKSKPLELRSRVKKIKIRKQDPGLNNHVYRKQQQQDEQGIKAHCLDKL